MHYARRVVRDVPCSVAPASKIRRPKDVAALLQRSDRLEGKREGLHTHPFVIACFFSFVWTLDPAFGFGLSLSLPTSSAFKLLLIRLPLRSTRIKSSFTMYPPWRGLQRGIAGHMEWRPDLSSARKPSAPRQPAVNGAPSRRMQVARHVVRDLFPPLEQLPMRARSSGRHPRPAPSATPNAAERLVGM